MKNYEKNFDHVEDESNPNCDFDDQTNKRVITTEDMQTIIKFVQLNAPMQVIRACYNLTSEEIIKHLVDYIVNSDIPDPFNNNIVKKAEETPVKPFDCSDTVQHDLQISVGFNNISLKDAIPRKMGQTHFDKYTYPDVIIKRVCECILAKILKRDIINALHISCPTFYRYFTDNEHVLNTLKDDILQQLRENKSMLSIYKEHKVGLLYIYALLAEYSLLDTYNFEKVVHSDSDKELSIAIERNLGIPEDDICRRYDISNDFGTKKDNSSMVNSSIELPQYSISTEKSSVLKYCLRDPLIGMNKLYFCAFPFPDSIIVKVCRKLFHFETKLSLYKILGMNNRTFDRYFFDEYPSYSESLRNAIVQEYKQHYSIFEIIRKYKLSCYGVYRTLIKSGEFNCTRTMEHRVEVTNKKLTVKEIIPIEYKLGEDIDTIAKRYKVAKSTVESIIHLAK